MLGAETPAASLRASDPMGIQGTMTLVINLPTAKKLNLQPKAELGAGGWFVARRLKGWA